jgi:hypothetical protein
MNEGPVFHQAIEDLNQLYEQVELWFRANHGAARMTYVIVVDNDEEKLWLGFGKVKGLWRLAVCHNNPDEPDSWIPIPEAGLKYRLASVTGFEKLKEAMNKSTLSQAVEVRLACDIIRRWLHNNH